MAGRRTYTREFRNEAVRLVTHDGGSVAEVARRLGISANTLRTWRRAAREDVRSVSSGDDRATVAAPEEELRRLRAENERLRTQLAQKLGGMREHQPDAGRPPGHGPAHVLRDAQDPAAVAEYMEQLLSRAGTRVRVDRPATEAPPARPAADTETTTAADVVASPRHARGEPRRPSERHELRAQTAVLREIANLAARSAVARHHRRRRVAELTAQAAACVVLGIVLTLADVDRGEGIGWRTAAAAAATVFFGGRLVRAAWTPLARRAADPSPCGGTPSLADLERLATASACPPDAAEEESLEQADARVVAARLPHFGQPGRWRQVAPLADVRLPRPEQARNFVSQR